MVENINRTGRPKRYESAAEKQRAYRKRKKALRNTAPETAKAPIPRVMWAQGRRDKLCYWCGVQPEEIGAPDCIDILHTVEGVRSECPLYRVVREGRYFVTDTDDTE